MLIATTDGLPGYEIRAVLGEVFGVSVQPGAPTGAPTSGTFRMPAEAPVQGLSQLRHEAVQRLGAEAQRQGANAIVAMRFDNGLLAGGGHEVCAYGTAVWVEPVTELAVRQAAQQPVPPTAAAPTSPTSPTARPPMAARNMTIGIRGDLLG